MIETITIELTGSADLDLMPPENGYLPTLRDVVLSSLLSDSREDLPGPLGTYRGGWAGDPQATDGALPDRIGSRLWTLRRATITEATLVRAGELSRAALQWLMDDGIVEQIAVVVTRYRPDGAQISIILSRGRASNHSYLWGAA